MTVRVVIMAQGEQTRLSMLPCRKQLLWLNACGTTILERTISLVREIAGRDTGIVVVGHEAIARTVLPCPVHLMQPTEVDGYVIANARPPNVATLAVLTLAKPGNSILRGLQAIRALFGIDEDDHPEDRTVVLLGDVVYSRACLAALLRRVVPKARVEWAVTEDLTAARGEVFGLSIRTDSIQDFLTVLDQMKHPPFEAYQCGQLRNLLWAWQEHIIVDPDGVDHPQRPSSKCCTFITDFTKDVDTFEDLTLLGALDVAAYRDDHPAGAS